MRLFIGVPLTGETTQEAARVMGLMRESRVSCRWVPPANLHCTVRFLGEVPEAQLPLVQGWFRTRLASFQPGPLQLARTGVFQNREQTVLWLGLDASWLSEAARRLGSEVAGLPVEERPFAAHVTLARVRPSRGSEWGQFLEEFLKVEVRRVAQTMSRLVLYRSRLGAIGAVYEEVCSWP